MDNKERKESRWDRLSGLKRGLIIVGCIVGFYAIIFGIVFIPEPPSEIRAKARKWETHELKEEARMGAKEGTVRIAPTGWIRVKSHDFTGRWYWFDKLNLWVASTGGILKHRKFYQRCVVVHESDTLKYAYLAFEEKLGWEVENNRTTGNRLVWKKYSCSVCLEGNVHLFLPSN